MVAFGAALMGPAGTLLLTAAAVFSLLGNVSGGMTGTTRTTYAMARDGLLPAWFGRVSERYATPSNSILFMGGLIAILALTGSFVWLAVVSTLARMIVYAASIAALPSALRGAGLRLGAGTGMMMAGGLLVCLWAAYQSQPISWAVLGGLLAVGLLLYAVARRQAGAAGTLTSR